MLRASRLRKLMGMKPNVTAHQMPTRPDHPTSRPREVSGDDRRSASRLLHALAYAFVASAPFYLHSLAVGPVFGTFDREARP